MIFHFSFIYLCFVLQLITSSKSIFEAMVYGSWNTIWMAIATDHAHSYARHLSRWRHRIVRSALRVTPPRSFNPERPFCFAATATDHVHSYYRYISQWRHARSFERVSHSDVTFPQLYTPCSSETKDVITSISSPYQTELEILAPLTTKMNLLRNVMACILTLYSPCVMFYVTFYLLTVNAHFI
jgi:hypothetical protein